MTSCPTVIIAGSASGVGKSSLSVGIMAALCERNMNVQAFKVGPDFVDPLYHSRATGRASVNLDRWFSSATDIRNACLRYGEGADFCVIEGTMGLLDDLKCPDSGDQSDRDLLPYNTAQLAKWLNVPVVLVMDGSRKENSIGALVRGYCAWDEGVEIGGIIFNNVKDSDDLSDLEAIVNSACQRKIPILGGVPNDDSFRNSTLESAFDPTVIIDKIFNLCTLVCENVDVDGLVSLARGIQVDMSSVVLPDTNLLATKEDHLHTEQVVKLSKNARKRARKKRSKAAKFLPDPANKELSCDGIDPANGSDEASSSTRKSVDNSSEQPKCRIGIARDSAFNFYYEENLDLLRDFGAELVFFSPLTDSLPSNISAVYLGGGVPELHASALADNKMFRAGLKKLVEAGGIVFAEGGGLLVLCQSLQVRTGFPPQPMVGIFPFRAIMSRTKVLKSYVEVNVGDECPLFPSGSVIRGYMSSNSELVQEQHIGGIVSTGQWITSYQARLMSTNKIGESIPEILDGYCTGNVLGSYFHHHFGKSPDALRHLIQKCNQVNVATVTSAVASARRTADCLEGSVSYTPPLTPVGHRGGSFGMVGVHSSPELNMERRNKSRPQSLDLNGLQYDPMMLMDGKFMTKTQSSGSLGHRTVMDNIIQDHKSSGAASPVQLGSSNDLTNMCMHRNFNHLNRFPGIACVHDADIRIPPGRMAQERIHQRISNNSDCPSILSSEGSEILERSNGMTQSNKNQCDAVQVAGKYQDLGNQYVRQAAQFLDTATPGPYGDHNKDKSIAVCDTGVRDIIQAFDIQASRLIDVSRQGLGPPIATDGSLGMLQSKSVQALQHFHARKSSSDMGSDMSLGGDDVVENSKMSFGRSKPGGPLDIDFEALAQVKPDIIIIEVPYSKNNNLEIHSVEKINRISPRTRLVKIAPHTLAGVLDAVLNIANAINEKNQGIAIVRKVRERLRKVVIYSQKAFISAGLPRRQKISVLGSLHPLTVEGGWVKDLIELVGGEAMQTNGEKARIITWEDLVTFAPDVLIICAPIINSGDKSAKVFNDLCDIASQPGWWQLPAVRDGVVVICEEALLSRMGLRLIDGAEALARIVYGDHVPTCCLPRSAFKLKLRPGQRVRPRLLPNYFMAYA